MEYTWILSQRKTSRKFRLIIWTLLLSQSVHPKGGEGMGLKGWMGNRFFSQPQISLY